MNPENHSFEEIAAKLRGAQKICVLSHVRPDPDAYGSQLALTLALRQLGKDVVAWNEDGMNEYAAFLPSSELVTTGPAEPQDFDVVVVLDTATKERAGKPLESIGQVGCWINIDHHVSNTRYGDLIYVGSDAPATAQILFEFFTDQGFEFTYGMADNLFAGISTDTGSFQYQSTTARTYEIAAELIRKGVNVSQISQHLYDNSPLRRVHLMKEMLNLMKLSSDGRICSAAVPKATIEKVGAQPDDTEGLIDILRGIEGVVVAAFFEELGPDKVRVSMRSKEKRMDVCKVAKQFNGGGHTLAAGARPTGTLAEVESNVLQALQHELDQFD